MFQPSIFLKKRRECVKLAVMSEEQFTQTLRDFKKRMPFVPFVVEMMDGRRVVIERPFLVFGGGVAGYISEESGFVDFGCGEVRTISPLPAETTS